MLQVGLQSQVLVLALFQTYTDEVEVCMEIIENKS